MGTLLTGYFQQRPKLCYLVCTGSWYSWSPICLILVSRPCTVQANTLWPNAPDKQRHSYYVGHCKGLQSTSYDPDFTWINLILYHTVRICLQEICVRSLGWEDPPEKGMATCSSILAWRIPWVEGHGGLQFMRLQRVGHDWATNTFITTMAALGLQ